MKIKKGYTIYKQYREGIFPWEIILCVSVRLCVCLHSFASLLHSLYTVFIFHRHTSTTSSCVCEYDEWAFFFGCCYCCCSSWCCWFVFIMYVYCILVELWISCIYSCIYLSAKNKNQQYLFLSVWKAFVYIRKIYRIPLSMSK